MKTILILGGYGFIGTNVIKYIDENLLDNYQVIVVDRNPIHPHGIKFKSIIKTYAGDWCDPTFINSVFAGENIDIVFHFISTTVPSTSSNVRFDLESNVIPSVEVLSSMRKYGVKKLVFLSSGGAIYGNGDGKNYETKLPLPISSYGVVKLCIEKYIMLYAQNFDLEPIILRLSNPYGKYHYSHKQGIINVLLRNLVNDEPFCLWGTGAALKDYIYIEDFCRILFLLLRIDNCPPILNVGSGHSYTIDDIIEIVKVFRPKFKIIREGCKAFDVSHSEISIDKLIDTIGDVKFTNLSDGIINTYKWIESDE